MNGFEKHGITHTSPSQLNMWIDCPAAWMAKYFYGHRFSFGVAAQVGVLTERVCKEVLTGELSLDAAIERAEKDFNRDNALNVNEKELARVSDIRAMAELAIGELSQYGKPVYNEDGSQIKIELTCRGDNWELPVIGYIDFYYPDHGVWVDLKTTLRIPSVMSDAHNRQAAVYRKALGNMAGRFLYVSPKKALWHEVDAPEDYLAQIKGVLNRQERALRYDAETLKSILPVNLSSFYWNGEESARKELFGI